MLALVISINKKRKSRGLFWYTDDNVFKKFIPRDTSIKRITMDSPNWDSDGNEYSAVGMESCGDLVEIYDDTIEPTENLN